MAAKAPVYRVKNHQPNVLQGLLEQAERAMEELNFVCRANLPISRHGSVVGYGVESTKKTIVCDHLASVIKEIKKFKAWN